MIQKKTKEITMETRQIRLYKDVEMRSAVDEEKGTYITGTPIVFESKTDIGGLFSEVIDRGALNDTDLKDIRLLINHNTDMIPLARSRNNNANSTMQLTPTDRGMDMRANLDVENNQDARSLVSALDRGDITGMSFMFSVNGDSWEGLDTDYPTRHITSISKVFEVSAVTFPAYESTEIMVDQRANDAEALENAKGSLESARAIREANIEEINNTLKELLADGNQ